MEDNDLSDIKQQYLMTEIVDKNYDQNKFVSFCLTKKENGDDLLLWTMDELKELVKEFQEKEKAEQTPTTTVTEEVLDANPANSLNAQPEEEIEKNQKTYETPIQKKVDEKKVIQAPPQEQKKDEPEVVLEIQCRKLEKTELNDKEIKVKIQNPEEAAGGLFTSKYVLYEVVTNVPENWVVKRRYNDFLWLRQAMVKYNPGQVVPPLPDRKIGKGRFEKEFIAERMIFLQKFMDALVKNEYFKASPPLIPFLSQTERGAFDAKMKEINSYLPSPYLEDFRTFSGTVNYTKENVDNEKYFDKIKLYFQNQDILYDNIKESFEKFDAGLKQCAKATEEIQKNFGILYELNDKVMMKKPIIVSYQQITNFFKSWKDILLNQQKVIKDHFEDYYQFSQMEGGSYHELIENREKIKAVYQSERAKLNAKKEKLFNGGDVNKFDLGDKTDDIDFGRLKSDKNYAFTKMCNKDSLKVDSMMKQFCYINRMNFEELKKMIDDNCVGFTQNIKDFCSEFYATLENGKSVISEIRKNITNVEEEVLK